MNKPLDRGQEEKNRVTEDAVKSHNNKTILRAVSPQYLAKNKIIYIPRKELKLCKRVSISKSDVLTLIKPNLSLW